MSYNIIERNNKSDSKITEWKTIGVRIKIIELANLNRQLDRLNYSTLGDLVKDLVAGKITRLTDDKQIEIMNINLQTTGQLTGLSGKPYDFYKQIDVLDFHKYLLERFQIHTANCYLSYFEKYTSIFFGLNPDIELFKLKPHKRSWILQSIKKFGEYLL